MAKLVRNSWSSGRRLKNCKGEEIDWLFIEELVKIQETEGLRLGTKVKRAHLQWREQPMKVYLAVQVLSKSTADALEYLDKVLKLEQFSGSGATVEFIRIFNPLFDILNSRSPVGKGTKAAMSVNNEDDWKPFFDFAYGYILGLVDLEGRKIVNSRRKTGFVGFLMAIKSISCLFTDLVQSGKMNYLLNYRFSQDHIELMFGAVRAMGGHNNNPTPQGFTAAYKRLLLHSSVTGGKGNCVPRDPTKILNILGDSCTVKGQVLSMSNMDSIRKYELEDNNTSPQHKEHNYASIPMSEKISEYKEASIHFIAGYVVKMVERKIQCLSCCKVIFSSCHGSKPRNKTLHVG